MRFACFALRWAPLLLLAVPATADQPFMEWETVRIRPNGITNIIASPLDPTRMYFTTQPGEVFRLEPSLGETPLLNIQGQVSFGAERGLLGMAFHPDFENNNFLFLLYVSDEEENLSHVARFVMDPDTDVIDPESESLIMTFGRLSGIHRAGWIGFGPDGMLYVASGDHARSAEARTPANEFGTIMRIDVDGDDFPDDPDRNYAIPADNPFTDGDDPRVLHYGLRNPWRCSFDFASGNLYIGDVLSGLPGEIDVVAADQRGLDFGWPCYEGDEPGFRINEDYCQDITPVFPHVTRPREGECATIGGYVYRGCELPELYGRYVFSDLCADRLWSFELVDGAATDLRLHEVAGELPNAPTTLGVNGYGEIYLGTSQGRIYRLRRTAPAQLDCNGDGMIDPCQIERGELADGNSNGIPDVCECPNDVTGFACDSDLNGDCIVNNDDLGVMLAAYLRCCGDDDYNATADLTNDCVINFEDLGELLADYLNDCRATD